MARLQIQATASESVRRLNPQIFGEAPSKMRVGEGNGAIHGFNRLNAESSSRAKSSGIPAVSGGETRQRRMNKTEARALEWLGCHGYTGIIAQPTRLFPLAGGGSYTPDFLAWKPGDTGVLVVEVKGGYRGPGWEQGYERYKRAALQYCQTSGPWRFAMLTWSARRREWTFEAWS